MMILSLVTLLGTAQASNDGTFWLPESYSTLAEGVDSTFYFIYWVSAFFFIVLMGAMLYFALAYKKKTDEDRTLDLKGSHTIELAWSVLPSFLLVAMFAMGFQHYVKSTVPPAESMLVRVDGWQWDWSYSYPTYGGFSTKELVVPNGTPVRLQMLSQDVLHSYYVPDFRIKKDVLPNRYTMQWFETTGITDNQTAIMKDNSYTDFAPIDAEEQRKSLGIPQLGETGAKDVVEMVASQCAKEKEFDPEMKCESDASKITAGVHQVYCTEYCGDHHSRMLSKVVVLEEEEFDLWIKAQRNFDPYEKFASTAEVGKYLYTKVGCNGCHSVNGSGGTGPTWQGLWGAERKFYNGQDPVAADENYIRESILQPQAKLVAGYEGANMNGGWESILEDRDIDAIIEYIKILK